MKRRTLIKWSVATATAASLGGRSTTSVGLSDVQRLRRATARLHCLDQQHGGETLWQSAVTTAQDGLHLLEQGSYTETVGRQLLIATGQLHVCAGWLAFDAGHHGAAQSCYTDALAIARQADDPLIETRALANLALQSNALAKPRAAQRYAAGAEQAAKRYPAQPWLAAIPQLRIAMASSLLVMFREPTPPLAKHVTYSIGVVMPPANSGRHSSVRWKSMPSKRPALLPCAGHRALPVYSDEH